MTEDQKKIAALNRRIVSQEVFIDSRESFLTNILNDVEKILDSDPSELHSFLINLKQNLEANLNFRFEFDVMKAHFEEVHPDFFEKLNQRSQELTTKDLRLAALIKMNFANKEIAFLTNLTHAGIKKAIQRLRKKLCLQGDEDLRLFISSI